MEEEQKIPNKTWKEDSDKSEKEDLLKIWESETQEEENGGLCQFKKGECKIIKI